MKYLYSFLCGLFLTFTYFYQPVICTSENIETVSPQSMSEKVLFWFMRNNTNSSQESSLSPKTRVKRQGSAGAGKFSEAALMSQTRVLQMWMQNVKNMFSPAHIGGSHPLHKDVPKPFVGLFKQSVMAFLFPTPGDDKVATK